jgi:hypothetical protein
MGLPIIFDRWNGGNMYRSSYELSAIQLRWCAANKWDGICPLPLRTSIHPFALYDPDGKLDSRHSTFTGAWTVNEMRFQGKKLIGKRVFRDGPPKGIIVQEGFLSDTKLYPVM